MARKNKSKHGGNPNRPRFWGKHAVAAALDNPDRKVLKAWSTREAADFMNFPPEVTVVMAEAPDLGRMVPHDAPHQGVVIEVEPLEDIWLADLLADAPERATLLVLDQKEPLGDHCGSSGLWPRGRSARCSPVAAK